MERKLMEWEKEKGWDFKDKDQRNCCGGGKGKVVRMRNAVQYFRVLINRELITSRLRGH